MAITRTQIARQLYQAGGGADFGAPDKAKDRASKGYGNVGGGKAASKGFKQDAKPGEQDSSVYGKSGPYQPPGDKELREIFNLEDDRKIGETRKDYKRRSLNIAEKFRINQLKKLYEKKFLPQKGFVPLAEQIIQSLAPTKLNVYEESDPMFDAAYYGMTGENITDADRLAEAINKAERTGIISQSDFEDAFYGPEGKPDLTSPDDKATAAITDPCKGPNPPAYCFANTEDPEDTTPTRNLGGLAPRFAGSIFNFDEFAADGGRIGAAEGGIMDLETGRQMYFLGKLVKKASRAVKKITKSPLGKAAILGGLAYFGGGGGGGFTNLLKKGFLKEGAGKFALENLSPLKTIGIVSALSGLMASQEEEEQVQLDRGPKLSMEELLAIRNNPYNTLASRFTGSTFAAEGGRMGYQKGSKEPVATKTMPLLDMGGQEMDFRDNGGFVPIGRMEKADDVPARLSKNEFVFTADAVRNAGDGDVDKGSEVMYNMMKNLESGGEVSEESQGLKGARKMFQTSKRLEEVI